MWLLWFLLIIVKMKWEKIVDLLVCPDGTFTTVGMLFPHYIAATRLPGRCRHNVVHGTRDTPLRLQCFPLRSLSSTQPPPTIIIQHIMMIWRRMRLIRRTRKRLCIPHILSPTKISFYNWEENGMKLFIPIVYTESTSICNNMGTK